MKLISPFTDLELLMPAKTPEQEFNPAPENFKDDEEYAYPYTNEHEPVDELEIFPEEVQYEVETENDMSLMASETSGFYEVNSESENGSQISILTPNENKQRSNKNISQLQKSGILSEVILNAISSNIKVSDIKRQLEDYNLSHSSGSFLLENSGKTVDALFTESVHQFQIANYIDPKEHDGILGLSTLDTLGLFNHKLRPTLNSAGFYGQQQLNLVKSDIPLATNGEFTASNWFNFIVRPASLGVKIFDGIHILLFRKLREAEAWLLSQPKYNGMTAASLGKALGFTAHTRYSGARLSANKQAMHGFGLAIDIDVSGNPWIGAGWIQHDKTLLEERYRMIKALRNASGDQTLPGKTIFEYLHHIAQSSGNDTAAAYNTLKQRNDEFITYLKTNSSELSYWKNSQTFAKRNPLNGFLNLHPDLVYALRQIAGLAWGAIDFGPRASGDIMHFDMRTIDVGKFLCEKIGGYVPDSGHPAIVKEVFSDEIMFEQMGNYEFKDESEFHEAIEEKDWGDSENESNHDDAG